MDNEVKISQKSLLALVVTLVVSLMAVAFLLGRQSGPSAPPPGVAQGPGGPEAPSTSRPLAVQPLPPQAPPPPATVVPAPAAPSAPVAAPAQVTAPPPAPAPAPVAESRPAPVAAPIAITPAEKPTPAADKSVSKAFVEYFSKIDELMLGTQSLGDPNQVATQILQQGVQGNTSGFDEMIETTKATLTGLRKLPAPQDCLEHHRLLVRQLEQSVSLLEKVKAATVAMDTAALTSLAGEGRGMQAEAQRFKQLDERLRAKL